MEEIEKFLNQYTHLYMVRLRDDIWRDLMGKAAHAMKEEIFKARNWRQAEMIRMKYSWIGKERFTYMLGTTFTKESSKR